MINNTNTDYADYTLGAGAGYLSYKGATKLGAKVRKPYAQAVMNNMRNFSENPLNRDALKKATYDGYVQSGLKAKKVYLHHVTPENIEQMEKLIKKKSFIIGKNSKLFQRLNKLKRNPNTRPLNPKEQEEFAQKLSQYLKNKEYKKAWKEFKNACKGKPISTSGTPDKIIKSDKAHKLSTKLKIVGKGENAFYSPITKDIMINTDKLGGASFHEMGHALNATGSKAIKALAIGRHITRLFVPLILAVGLLKPKKKDGQESNGVIDKATTFIKNNAGKLTFAALIPTLAEEGLASIRGGQIAKKVLGPKLLKQVNKHNFFAWTTYLAGALVTSGSVALAVKIRDAIAEKK